jgi:lipopolysaccharide transport system permease protein
LNPHAPHPSSPLALLRTLWTHRALVRALVAREIVGRYKGSLLGVLWSFLTPLLMVLVFTFVFGEIFQARWAGSPNSGGMDFASALFTGLLAYQFLSECLSRAPNLIVANANYVKKVVFPLEILPVVSVIAAVFHLLVAYAILIGLILASHWTLGPSALLAPVVLLPYIALTLGLTWAISAIGVYLRDIGQIIQPALTALLFLSPVFYPLSSVPAALQPVYLANPVTYVSETLRGVLLHQTLPDPLGWLVFTGISLLVAWLGLSLFQTTRKGFADVI